MINLFSHTIDTTSAATVTRDTQELCREVNEFIKNPSVLIQRTEFYVTLDSTDLQTIWLKLDYNLKSTGG